MKNLHVELAVIDLAKSAVGLLKKKLVLLNRYLYS